METDTGIRQMKGNKVSEDDAVAAQAAEIVQEITFGALQILEEHDLSAEEGDDSVFYSDEEHSIQETEAKINCDLGAGKKDGEKCIFNIEAAGVKSTQATEDRGTSENFGKDYSEMEKQIAEMVWVHLTEEEHGEVQIPKDGNVSISVAADSGPDRNQTQRYIPITRRLVCSVADTETQHDASAEKEDLLGEDEISPTPSSMVLLMKTETANSEPFEDSNEKSQTTLNREALIAKQPIPDHVHVSTSGQQAVDQDLQQDHNPHCLTWAQQGPNPGTQPVPNKSRYDTVSYRKIRKGNTRQKIEEFESMIMNL